MSFTTTINTTFEVIECGSCGCNFALTEKHFLRLRREHSTFYCPGCGSSRHFPGESDLEKLTREKQQTEERLRREQVRSNHFENSARSYKGHATKQKKKLARVLSGTCPECNRTFQNLKRHMKTKHSKTNYTLPEE